MKILLLLFIVIGLTYSCMSQSALNFSIEQSLVLIAEAGSDTSIIEGDSLTLGGTPTANGGTPGYVYYWTPSIGLDDNTLANPIATMDSTTTYTVTVTDSNGCSSSDNITINVNPSGLDDRTSAFNFSIYPNPNKGSFSLVLKNAYQLLDIKVEVINNFGQMIYFEKMDACIPNIVKEIDISNQISGIYFVKIEGKDVRSIMKVIIH